MATREQIEQSLRVAALEARRNKPFDDDELEMIVDVWDDEPFSYWCLKCDKHYNICGCRATITPEIHIPLR